MECYGIDFGSQLAGTTVVACYHDGAITLQASAKKKNADTFLEQCFQPTAPQTIVCIDAPLSLPRVYREGTEVQDADYFYRAADRELRAMSPMFLGGLTARAMRFAAYTRKRGYAVWETYPAAQARRLGLERYDYKGGNTSIRAVMEVLASEFPCDVPSDLPTWHHVDALLCLLAALRLRAGSHELYGAKDEGVIIV